MNLYEALDSVRDGSVADKVAGLSFYQVETLLVTLSNYPVLLDDEQILEAELRKARQRFFDDSQEDC